VISRDGLLTLEIGGEIIDLRPKSTAFFSENATAPRYDIPVPAALLQNLGPKPEDIRVDPKLFEKVSRTLDAGTLNVSVYDKGQADVTLNDGTRLSLGKGESVQAGQDELVRLKGIPVFVTDDPLNFSPAIDVESGEQLPPLDTLDSGGPDNSVECTI
jgi:hypothetical protein